MNEREDVKKYTKKIYLSYLFIYYYFFSIKVETIFQSK